MRKILCIVRAVASACLALMLGCRAAMAQGAGGQVVDDFTDVSGWKVVASDGVEGRISRAEPRMYQGGAALRLDFDFKKGSGYCIARRELDLEVPENFRFSYAMIGVGDPSGKGFENDHEFKLYDASGDNVWWRRLAGHWYSPRGEEMRHARSQIEFAWGPDAGKTPLRRVRAIEFAVTAGKGGKGYVLIERLALHRLPARAAEPLETTLSVTGQPVVRLPPGQMEARDIELNSRAGPPRLVLDFGAPRAFGGVLMEWDGSPPEIPAFIDLKSSPDGETDEAWAGSRPLPGDPLMIYTGDGADVARVTMSFSWPGDATKRIKRLMVLPPEAGRSANGRAKVIAAMSPRGWYPRYFSDEAVTWAVFGEPGAESEGLLSGDGQVELAKGGRTIEPFLWADGRLWTWADFESSQSLREDRLPLPITHLKCGGLGLALDVEPCAVEEGGVATVLVRYTLRNDSGAPRSGRLILALRQFQALPPWHALNMEGGVSRGSGASSGGARCGRSAWMWLNPDQVGVLGPADNCGVAMATAHDIVSRLAAGSFGDEEAKRRGADGSACLGFDFSLQPGERRERWVHAIIARAEGSTQKWSEEICAQKADGARDDWTRRINSVTLKLPPAAKEIEDTFYAQIGWVLVNRDGPAIQPGSRTYDRTWIRDGSLTSTALLYTGHAQEVKEFLDWFKDFQYEDGKIPCCVDERGPDPVPENDSHGQYLYGVATYHRFTGDDELLRRHWSHVVAAVGYIQKLRATRMTDAYKGGPDSERVKFGLMPESISHEGYSAKPMHSYWDDLFTLRGLKDAVYIAGKLGEHATAAQWATLRDDFRRTLVESVALAMKNKGVDYIPGCAELGDFDATSTAVAVFPCAEAEAFPPAAVARTFDKEWEFFTSRRDGRIEWNDYTPYENRLISAQLMLGHPDRAHALMDWFMKDRNPAGWRQWGEIVWKDQKAPKYVGDLPHTWVGSDFLKAVRNLCVYEREADDSLVLCAGLPRRWVETPEGITVGGLPTEFGPLSYRLKGEKRAYGAAEWRLSIDAGIHVPSGGVWFAPMLEGATLGGINVDGKAVDPGADGRVRIDRVPAEVVISLNGLSKHK